MDERTGFLAGKEEAELNEFELLEQIGKLQAVLGGESAHNCLLSLRGRGNKGEICPISLILGREIKGVHIDNLVDWQSASEDYHVMPFPGNWLAQPKWLTQAFNHVKVGKISATNDIQDSILKKK